MRDVLLDHSCNSYIGNFGKKAQEIAITL